jgi:periplasmic protein CpxP/Spy
MRNTLCTLALAGLLTVGGGAAIAQDNAASTPQQGQGYGHRGMMSPDEQLNHLTKALNLSSDQQTQIKPILENAHQQAMQIHQDQSLAQQDRFAKMQALHQDTNTKIEAVLNDPQKQKFEQMQAKRMEHMRGGQAPAPQQQ